jgi:hypothetical protein
MSVKGYFSFCSYFLIHSFAPLFPLLLKRSPPVGLPCCFCQTYTYFTTTSIIPPPQLPSCSSIKTHRIFSSVAVVSWRTSNLAALMPIYSGYEGNYLGKATKSSRSGLSALVVTSTLVRKACLVQSCPIILELPRPRSSTKSLRPPWHNLASQLIGRPFQPRYIHV